MSSHSARARAATATRSCWPRQRWRGDGDRPPGGAGASRRPCQALPARLPALPRRCRALHDRRRLRAPAARSILPRPTRSSSAPRSTGTGYRGSSRPSSIGSFATSRRPSPTPRPSSGAGGQAAGARGRLRRELPGRATRGHPRDPGVRALHPLRRSSGWCRGSATSAATSCRPERPAGAARALAAGSWSSAHRLQNRHRPPGIDLDDGRATSSELEREP